MAVSSQKKERCFISSPFGFSTQVLQRALDSRKITWRHVADLPTNRPPLQSIEAAIKSSDFACGIITKANPSSPVLFELGLATGLGLPLLIFVERGAEVPPFFRSLTCIYVLPEEERVVAGHLDSFLRSTIFSRHKRLRSGDISTQLSGSHKADATSPRLPKTEQKTMQDVAWARSELAQLSRSVPDNSGRQLEGIMRRLFEQAGAQVTLSHWSDSGVDMALWVDRLEVSIGNPILVEIKTQLTASDLNEVITQLRSTALSSGAPCAVLIYLSNSAISPTTINKTQIGTLPMVFAFNSSEVVTLVEHGTLFDEILNRRNRAAHGII